MLSKTFNFIGGDDARFPPFVLNLRQSLYVETVSFLLIKGTKKVLCKE